MQSGYGNKIEIRHWDGTCSWYGHLSKIDVKVGQKVEPAELIGLVGSTGHSTGPHLHLEIHPHGGGPVTRCPGCGRTACTTVARAVARSSEPAAHLQLELAVVQVVRPLGTGELIAPPQVERLRP